MTDERVTYIGKNRVATICLIDTFAAEERTVFVTSLTGKGQVLPPDSIDDLLTRCAFDEPLGLANYCHFNSIANSIVQIVVLLAGNVHCHRIGTRINRPTGNCNHSQVKEVIPILAETSNSQDFAEMCSGTRESRCREIVIANKMYAVQEKAEDNGFVTLVLKIEVFLG
jgi:hypothetical protein